MTKSPLNDPAKQDTPVKDKQLSSDRLDQDKIGLPPNLKIEKAGTIETNTVIMSHPTASRSIKAVAIYEIVKGLGALLAATALWLWHNDLNTWLNGAVALWHKHFGQLLLNQVDSLVANAITASHHWHIFLIAIVGYASLRFIEAYGLWMDKTWAYWFSVLGYGIFIPLELYYLIVSPLDWFKVTIFVLNVIIVIVVYRNMKRKGLI